MSGKKRVARVMRDLGRQGVTHRRLPGGGYFLYLPGGGTATVHLTNSDPRAGRNMRSVLNQHGITIPRDL